MSYWVGLDIATGGDHTASVLHLNMTSNVAGMWRRAGADLYEMKGMLARDAAPILRAAIAKMEAEPEEYRKLNPKNGWGSYEGCLAFLKEIASACEAHPACVMSVSA